MANRIHWQGLDGCLQKNLAFLSSISGSTKKCCAIAHENCRNEGMLASGLVWPSKWVVQAVMANRMHRQGLDGRLRKFFAFLTSESGSPKKWCAIAHKNRRNEGMLASGLLWPSKWVLQAVMANRMHRQGLEGRPRKNFALLTSEYGSPKKWCAIAHENHRNKAYASFGDRLTLQMGRKSHDGQPYA